MGIEKLSDFVYSKTKRNKSLNKGGPTIMKKKKLISLFTCCFYGIQPCSLWFIRRRRQRR